MSKQIEKKSLFHCRYCQKILQCKWFFNQQHDSPCNEFELIKLDIRMVSE